MKLNEVNLSMKKKTFFLSIVIVLFVSFIMTGCHLFGEDINILTYYTPTPTPGISDPTKYETQEVFEHYHQRLSIDVPVNSLNALITENIPLTTSQVILVTITNDGEKIYCVESMENGWKVVYGPFDCNIGRSGLGKIKEGDGKSPEGVFELGSAFGQGGAPSLSSWPWRETDKDDYWVEDSNSKYYNQYVNLNDTEKDWKSAENLFISNYIMALEVKYNPLNEEKLGSAIFLHVWDGENINTGGCTSMAESTIKIILKWLRPEAKPLLFQTKYINQIPDGFCYIKDFTPEIVFDIRFAGKDNFIGRPANEYYRPVGIASVEMARKLDKASLLLKEQGLKLLVYDSYRPQTTVNTIVDWLSDEDDVVKKDIYYPNIEKSEMIDMFFEARSPYPRGAAVDVSIVDEKGVELDMGTVYQFIDETSSFDYKDLTDEQYNNRELLRDTMIQAGLLPNDTFWWSFFLVNEPFADLSFDFYIQ